MAAGSDPIEFFERGTAFHTGGGRPIRFVVTATTEAGYECEVGLVERTEAPSESEQGIFRYVTRKSSRSERFTTALLIPTGIGLHIGGHAGDAGPVATLMGAVSDRVILHPNVVNASDINEMPANALYVEGSVLTRLLMGTVGLSPVRQNRVLVLLHDHENAMVRNAAINSVNAARATYGLSCQKIVLVKDLRMRSQYGPSGRASGEVEGLRAVIDLLESERQNYDAVAISSVIEVPSGYHQEYFDRRGAMVNPWGGIEALLTHSISDILNVPSAHSPMIESEEIANADPGVVEPRMAAEAVSLSYLQCILKGLSRSPQVVTDMSSNSEAVTAADVSCLVVPDGCVGLPVLAALQQNITVIAVRENTNLMRNDLSRLPWREGQFYTAENYWEAAGIIGALRAGIPPATVRSPIQGVSVEVLSDQSKQDRVALHKIR